MQSKILKKAFSLKYGSLPETLSKSLVSTSQNWDKSCMFRRFWALLHKAGQIFVVWFKIWTAIFYFHESDKILSLLSDLDYRVYFPVYCQSFSGQSVAKRLVLSTLQTNLHRSWLLT